MAKSNSSKRPRLSAGRPPTARKKPAAISSKATRNVIRTHHRLSKQAAKADQAGETEKAKEIQKRMEESGGLLDYQLASIQGQSNERGGDSSRVLLDWMKDASHLSEIREARRPRLLEVGALSTQNACTTCGLFDITRIDLHSQAEGIIQQDFMMRPLPDTDSQRFDIISLSLVLNFVPDAGERGEMLRRTCHFLEKRREGLGQYTVESPWPALFVVLPAACVMNSRYLNEARLVEIMACLGYVKLRRTETAKLVYYLWHYGDINSSDVRAYPKKQVHPGRQRNNFCVILR